MPRVSEDYLAARRRQILEASWRCFARDGFHGTSMQDIFAEAGLSAGAVYRYFSSKLDLIKATASEVSQTVSPAFDALDAAGPVLPPDEAFGRVLDAVFTALHADGFDRGRIAVHVWSEALREPAVGEVVSELGRRLRSRWAAVSARWRDAGHVSADADPEEIARIMYGLMAGFLLQHQLLSDVTPEQYVRGFSALLARPGKA